MTNGHAYGRRAEMGLMQGVLVEWNPSFAVDRHHPFVEPNRCLAPLVPVGATA